jgi:phage portal protein BeeE
VAKLWNSLVGKKSEERMYGFDELYNYYNNSGGMLFNSRGVQGNHESIDSDFVGYVQGAYKSSGIVYAVCEARRKILSEASFVYQKRDGARPGDVRSAKELRILEKPWPNGTSSQLISRMIQDADLAGNAYVLREGVGESSRLRRLRPDWVDIILSAPPDKAVQSDVIGYLFRPGGTKDKTLWKTYPVDGSLGAIAHYAPNPDPEASYRGMSFLTPILREIQLDRQTTKHKLKFFENAATPNLAVSFKETVTSEQFDEFMKSMDEQKNGVDHAYETLYLGGGADVTVVGADIKAMDFKSITGTTESRIASAGGVPPSIVGFAEGLQGSGLNGGNRVSDKDMFADLTLRPLWRDLCAALEPLVAEFDGERLWFDTRDIAFLRQDAMELAEIRARDANTMASLIMNGFVPDTVVDAIEKQDWYTLEHTGLFSVQLLPPGTVAKAPAGAEDPAAKASTKVDASTNADTKKAAVDKAKADKAAKNPKG